MWMLHEKFSDLERSAAKGCRSCQLVWKMIVFDTPSLAELNKTRLSNQRITVMGDLENGYMKGDMEKGYFCVAYGTGSTLRLPTIRLTKQEGESKLVKSE